MKTIVILLGLTASQIQGRSNVNLEVSTLYDYDARRFQGPIAVQYQIKDVVIDLPESELVSLSFRMGILTSANVTPHRRPLDGRETARLSQELKDTFTHHGFVMARHEANEFKEFAEGLKLGQRSKLLPPWSFVLSQGDESVRIVVRPFENSSASTSGSNSQRYMIALDFANLKLSEMVYKRMDEAKAKYFPNRQGQIPMTEYPKEFSLPKP